jgi:pyruvate,water dikinase
VWRASRNEMTLDELVRAHGQHGPLEGELSARVWREDSTGLERLVAEYAQRPDGDNPLALEAERMAARERLEEQLLANVPGPARPVARKVLDHGRAMIPLRGMAKGQFLRAFDVARAAARRAGELHAEAGVLDDPEDVFYLVTDELTHTMPADVRDRVAQRRQWRAAHEQVRLPTWWTGDPVPLSQAPPERRAVLQGIGVSGGRVEGIARVVTDPTFADCEPDEILVSPTTDPGWASIMFISSALVVDIGGHLSHAAIVARELGIPCVVDTGDGSRVIQTGDRLVVDGDAGTVTVLPRESPP